MMYTQKAARKVYDRANRMSDYIIGSKCCLKDAKGSWRKMYQNVILLWDTTRFFKNCT